MLVIGHRGAPYEGLENSLDSFHKAISSGCHMIELDVWGAKDSSLWVCHDDSLKRTANSTQKISSLTRTELSKIKLKNNEPLPELISVLEQFLPRVKLNLEIKDPKEETLHSLLETLAKISNPGRIVLSSFDLSPLEFIEKKTPELQLALLWESTHSNSSEALTILEKHPKWYFHPQANTLDHKIVKELHREKKTIYPWVPKVGVEGYNREKLWQTMLKFNIHGLCTNYPREFNLWLSKVKKHNEL